MKFDFGETKNLPPLWKTDSKKERLRKYVKIARIYLKQYDLKSVDKTLTTIEELYNANN